MQIPIQKLLRLLKPDQSVETRRAAALVLGELGSKESAAEALLETLQDAEGAVRIEAIRAIGKLRIDKALSELLERVRHGGEEAPPAALAAANLGNKGIKALQELMSEVPPGLRRIIAGALAGADQTKSDSGRLSVLFDNDPAVVHAAARSLMERVPTLSTAQRQSLASQALELLDHGKAKPSPATASALVRILSSLDDPRAEPYLWQRIAADQPTEVRAAALQALGKKPLSSTKDHVKKLLACAQDREFSIVAPALLLLRTVSVTKKNLGEWLPLFSAPDVAVRNFALEHLGTTDDAQVAEGLLAQLPHPDQQLRRRALDQLAKLETGQTALTKALVKEENVERAWTLARALGERVKEFPASWRKDVFARVCKHIDKDDHHADPLLFALRNADARELRDRLEERAKDLRKKKAYDKALPYLRILAKDPACAFALRLELAACGLKLSNHDLSPDALTHDPSLNQFDHLYRSFGDELIKETIALKWLDVDDLYYVGFHLAGKDGPARKFAEKILREVIKRAGKTKTGQAAKSKLRKEGLAEK